MSCGGAREPLVTYFNGEYGLSLRHPASWKTEQAEQDGVWYRYFLGPPTGPKGKPAVSVTLLAGPLGGSLEDYARSYVGGNKLSASRDESRQGAKGRSYEFASADGATRYALLLLQEGNRVFGLYAQGEASFFERDRPTLEEMAVSLALERPAYYPELRDVAFAFSLRVPASWRESRHFSGGQALLMQFTSPPLAVDKSRETVHASLTLTAEPAGDGGIEAYYEATRRKLGESFLVLSHTKWRDGYMDQMRSETPVAVSRVKRFYRAAGPRGYSMTFEARDDVFPKVSRWCDIIAGTMKIGPEVTAP